MPGGTLPLIGNNALCQRVYASVTPAASISGAASSTSTYTIKGLVVGDATILCPQGALTNPLSADAVWVSAPDTLSISWTNASSSTSSSSPAATACVIIVIRPSNIYAGVTNYPTKRLMYLSPALTTPTAPVVKLFGQRLISGASPLPMRKAPSFTSRYGFRAIATPSLHYPPLQA